MFDFDAGKLIVIGVVALIVIGPKELPRVLRQLGQAYSKMRRMAADFQGQFMDAMREAELDDIKKDLQAVGDAAKIDVAFNPLTDIKQQMTSAIEGEPKSHHVGRSAGDRRAARGGLDELDRDAGTVGCGSRRLRTEDRRRRTAGPVRAVGAARHGTRCRAAGAA